MFETRSAWATSETVENLALAYSIFDRYITPLRQSRMYANVAEVQSGSLGEVADGTPFGPDGGRSGQSLRPSSRERAAAAVTASSTEARNPRVSKTCKAAAVVPPGEVTAVRSTSGDSPVSASRRADPSSVSTVNSRLTSRSRPSLTPASTSASANKKT